MEMKNILIITSAIIGLMWSTGCRKYSGIAGNGTVGSETRPSVSFNKVNNMDEFNVYCVYDTVFRVVIEAESNLIPYIRTVVNGNTLHISTYENLDNNYVIKVIVHTPSLNEIELSGSGLIDVSPIPYSGGFRAYLSGSGNIYGSVNTVNFEAISSGSGNINLNITSVEAVATVRGSGDIILSGTSENSRVEIYGSGDIDSFNLPVTECRAKISGSGNIYTTVSDLLIAKIYGSGDIIYRGNPIIESDINGSGNIIGG